VPPLLQLIAINDWPFAFTAEFFTRRHRTARRACYWENLIDGEVCNFSAVLLMERFSALDHQSIPIAAQGLKNGIYVSSHNSNNSKIST
jgi:hypothetical protein